MPYKGDHAIFGVVAKSAILCVVFFKTTLKQDKIAKNQAGSAGSVPYISPRQFFKIIQICTFKLKGFTSIQSILNAKLGQHRFFID